MERDITPVQGGMTLLPAKAGTCAYCATKHGEHDPHNFQSLSYGVRFLAQYGRDLTHADCVAHLSAKRRQAYRDVLPRFSLDWSEPVGEPISEPYLLSHGLRPNQEEKTNAPQ